MANSTHLAKLKNGVKSWNQWRRANPRIIPDLRKADLSQSDLSLANFRSANLSGAKFTGSRLFATILSKADLSNANLSKTNLKFADLANSNLSKANLSGANLSEANLRKAFLGEADLSKTNLSRAILKFANLNGANLSKADLTLAVFKAANLQNADLSAVQAWGTDYTETTLTAACLQGWSINDSTTLESVQCEYVYLKRGFEFSNRHPSDRIFRSGEFIEMFQKPSETTEVFSTSGIAEFFESFQELRQHHPDKLLSIKEIEPKSDNKIIARLEVLPEFNKEAAREFHEEQLQLVRQTYELQAMTHVVESYKQQNAELLEIAKLHAVKPITLNVETTAMSNSERFTNNLQGANVANFSNQVNDNARQQANQYNSSLETKSLADAAKEIQSLLDQLSQSYPVDTTAAKCTFASQAIQRIDDDPSLTQRILSALGAGSTSALAQLLNHPAASFVISALEDWKKTHMQ